MKKLVFVAALSMMVFAPSALAGGKNKRNFSQAKREASQAGDVIAYKELQPESKETARKKTFSERKREASQAGDVIAYKELQPDSTARQLEVYPAIENDRSIQGSRTLRLEKRMPKTRAVSENRVKRTAPDERIAPNSFRAAGLPSDADCTKHSGAVN